MNYRKRDGKKQLRERRTIIELKVVLSIGPVKNNKKLIPLIKINNMTAPSFGLDSFKKGDNWKVYIEQLNSLISLNDIPREKQKAFLITQLSIPVYEILCNLCLPNSPQDSKYSYDDLVKKLSDHFASQEKYIARFEYHREKQGPEEIVKEYKFKEQHTEGVKSEAMCLKVFKGAGHLKDLIKIATEVEWGESQTFEKRSHCTRTTNQKTGLFTVSQIRRTHQSARKRFVDRHVRQKSQSQNQENNRVSTKFCYCCGKNNIA